MQRARRENRALGLSNITVINGELVEEKPDGTIILLGKKGCENHHVGKRGARRIRRRVHRVG